MLLALTIMAFSAEARASCAVPQGCVCTFRNRCDRHLRRHGGGGEGRVGEDFPPLKIRIDELSVADASSKLEVGKVADAQVGFVNMEVKQGDRVLGYSTPTCANPIKGCAGQPIDQERLGIRALLDPLGFVPCSGQQPFSSADARALLLDPDCEAELSKRLGTEDEEVACHDVACLCSAPGARSASGRSAALGLLAIVAAWGLRRSRR